MFSSLKITPARSISFCSQSDMTAVYSAATQSLTKAIAEHKAGGGLNEGCFSADLYFSQSSKTFSAAVDFYPCSVRNLLLDEHAPDCVSAVFNEEDAAVNVLARQIIDEGWVLSGRVPFGEVALPVEPA